MIVIVVLAPFLVFKIPRPEATLQSICLLVPLLKNEPYFIFVTKVFEEFALKLEDILQH